MSALRLQPWARRRKTLRDAVSELDLPGWILSGNAATVRRALDGEPATRLHGVELPPVTGLGGVRLRALTQSQVQRLRDQVVDHVGAVQVAHAARTGRPLTSYRADDHGQGAGRNVVQVMHRILAEAQREQWLRVNAAEGVTPPRLHRERRPLVDDEVNRLHRWIDVARTDPELDHLIVDLLLHTGFRREGILGLTVDSADAVTCLVHSYQKGSVFHELPVTRSILRRACDLARDRVATTGSSPLLRRQSGDAVTRNYLQRLFRAAQHDHVWGQSMAVTPHWFRHTCRDRIRRATGDQLLAEMWIGHSVEGLGSGRAYLVLPGLPELRTAAAAAFGPLEDEPLLRGNGGQVAAS